MLKYSVSSIQKKVYSIHKKEIIPYENRKKICHFFLTFWSLNLFLNLQVIKSSLNCNIKSVMYE